MLRLHLPKLRLFGRGAVVNRNRSWAKAQQPGVEAQECQLEAEAYGPEYRRAAKLGLVRKRGWAVRHVAYAPVIPEFDWHVSL